MPIKITVFGDVMQFSLANIRQCLGRICCFRLEDKMGVAGYLQRLVPICHLHDVTRQKTVIFSPTAVWT